MSRDDESADRENRGRAIRRRGAQAGVEVKCGQCGTIFSVAESQRGGLVNCPDCGRLCGIDDDEESIFWILVGLGIFVAVAISTVVAFTGGLVAGMIVLGISALVIFLCVINS